MLALAACLLNHHCDSRSDAQSINRTSQKQCPQPQCALQTYSLWEDALKKSVLPERRSSEGRSSIGWSLHADARALRKNKTPETGAIVGTQTRANAHFVDTSACGSTPVATRRIPLEIS